MKIRHRSPRCSCLVTNLPLLGRESCSFFHSSGVMEGPCLKTNALMWCCWSYTGSQTALDDAEDKSEWKCCTQPSCCGNEACISEAHSALSMRAFPSFTGLGPELCRGEGMWKDATLRASVSGEFSSLLQHADGRVPSASLLSCGFICFHWCPSLLIPSALWKASRSHLCTTTAPCNMSWQGESQSSPLLQLPPPALLHLCDCIAYTYVAWRWCKLA